jgi:two-component system, cell cycle response regulator
MSIARPAWDQVFACSTLPSLPTVGVEVLALSRDPNVSVEQLARVVERDPALSAKVLKTVNSSLFGLSQPCTTIRRALGYLGMSAVKSLVLGFSLMESTRSVGKPGAPDQPALDMDAYWQRAMLAAAGARVIAQATRAADPDEAFTASLFQDLGVLAMYSALGEQYTSAVASAPTDHARHSELELAAFGFTHSEVGAALATKWRLPDRYMQVIRLHHTPDAVEPAAQGLVRVVALGTSVALAAASPGPDAGQAVADLLVRANIWFGSNALDLEQMLEKISSASTEVAKLFDKSIGQQPDLRSLLQQAGEEQMIQHLAAMREAEDLRVRNQQLLHQAYTDALTGLANRKRFDEEAGRLVAESRSIGRSVALIMVDGDKFKSVNDTYGHHVGDAVLKELASRIKTASGDRGTACRYGGEEFAILAPGLTRTEAIELAEAIRKAIADAPFALAGVEGAPATLPVTASFGVAVTDPAAQEVFSSVGALLHAADAALYEAKHAGRNRVSAHTRAADVSGSTDAAPAPIAAHAAPPNTTQSATIAEVRPSASPASGAAAGPAGVPAAAPSTGPSAGPKPGVIRILLIEDDALAAKLMITLFSKSPGTGGGVEVEWIRDGTAAVRRICEAASVPAKRPSVIVTDIQIPGTDGITLTKAARAIPALAKTPIVVVSSQADPATGKKCQAAGATAFLAKHDLAADLQKWVNVITVQYAGASKAA